LLRALRIVVLRRIGVVGRRWHRGGGWRFLSALGSLQLQRRVDVSGADAASAGHGQSALGPRCAGTCSLEDHVRLLAFYPSMVVTTLEPVLGAGYS